MMYKLVDRETNNGNFGEYETLSELTHDLIEMLKEDMENEDIFLDEAVNYYEVLDSKGDRYLVDCEYNPDRVFIMTDNYSKIVWSELVK